VDSSAAAQQQLASVGQDIASSSTALAQISADMQPAKDK
jgi:hypothetical protein